MNLKILFDSNDDDDDEVPDFNENFPVYFLVMTADQSMMALIKRRQSYA